eukprot:Opistho-2@20874
MGSVPSSVGYVYWYWATLVMGTVGRLMMYQSTSIYEALAMNLFIGFLEYVFRRTFHLRRELLARLAKFLRLHVSESIVALVFGQLPKDADESKRMEARELEVYASALNVLTMVKVQSSILALVVSKAFVRLQPCYELKGGGDEATDIVNLILMLVIGYAIDFVSTIWEQGQRIDVVGDIHRRPMIRSYVYLGATVLILVHLVDFSFINDCPVRERG